MFKNICEFQVGDELVGKERKGGGGQRRELEVQK